MAPIYNAKLYNRLGELEELLDSFKGCMCISEHSCAAKESDKSRVRDVEDLKNKHLIPSRKSRAFFLSMLSDHERLKLRDEFLALNHMICDTLDIMEEEEQEQNK